MEREGDFDLFAEIINTLSNWLYTYILIILLLGAGVFFTIKTRFVQFRCLREAIRVVKEPSDDKESISSSTARDCIKQYNHRPKYSTNGAQKGFFFREFIC